MHRGHQACAQSRNERHADGSAKTARVEDEFVCEKRDEPIQPPLGGTQQTQRCDDDAQRKPWTVTTAVCPIRNGRCGSRSSSTIRTGKRCESRTQLSVGSTCGNPATVAPFCW